MKHPMKSHPYIRNEVGPHGLELLQINSPMAQATISLQGAQVLHFQGAGEAPMLWQGMPQTFASGKALRAGVPICWPWFSTHPEPGYPAHGFARNSLWELQEVLTTADGRLQLIFALPAHHALWPTGLRVQYRVTIGATLELELRTENTGLQPQTLSQALHTYFNVGDVRQVQLRGLSSYPYFDYGVAQAAASGEALLGGFEAIERIYVNPKGYCELIDPLLGRSILVTSSGSRSTVVWNPGPERAKAMGDLGTDGYLRMLCIESANVPLTNDEVTLEPGRSHTLAVQYRVISQP